MATTQTPADLQEQRYRRQYWEEYVRQSAFMPYMGAAEKGPMSIIHTTNEMAKGGKSLTIPLVSRLTSQGVKGNTRLSGSEEALGKHTHQVTVEYYRNAVELSEQDERYDFSNARDSVRPQLKLWSSQQLRDAIIDSMHTVSFSGSTNSTINTPLHAISNTVAGTSALDTWCAANSDRVLFGKLVGNYNATFATALATIDNTDDKLTAAAIGTMKRIAKTADPHIRPYMTDDGREYFVCFVGSSMFRDIKADSTIIANNRDARAREGNGMDKNPIFQDGDLLHEGVIIREVPEFPVFSNGTINCGLAAFCGAQAITVAWGQEPMFTKKNEDDYGFFTGIGIQECRGANKVMRKHGTLGTYKDHGMVSGFFAAVGDA